MLYLGWIAAAFFGGLLAAFALRRRDRPTLRQRFAALGVYRGVRYDEILCGMHAVPRWTERTADGRILRTWSEAGYAITLEFDACDICLGVADERF